MTDPSTHRPSDRSPDETQQTSPNPQPDSQTVDPRDLVYTSVYDKEQGSISENPREIINHPAVAPQMHTLNDTTENLRDDMFRDSNGE